MPLNIFGFGKKKSKTKSFTNSHLMKRCTKKESARKKEFNENRLKTQSENEQILNFNDLMIEFNGAIEIKQIIDGPEPQKPTKNGKSYTQPHLPSTCTRIAFTKVPFEHGQKRLIIQVQGLDRSGDPTTVTIKDNDKRQEFRSDIEIVVEEDYQTLQLAYTYYRSDDSSRKLKQKYTVKLPATVPDREEELDGEVAGQANTESVRRDQLDNLLSWHGIFNNRFEDNHKKGSHILTRAERNKWDQAFAEEDRLAAEKPLEINAESTSDNAGSTADEEEKRPEPEPVEEPKPVDEPEPVAEPEPVNEPVAPKKKFPRKLPLPNGKIDAEMAKAHEEYWRKQNNINNMKNRKNVKNVFLPGIRSALEKQREKLNKAIQQPTGVAEETQVEESTRRLAANDSMDNALSMLWILPLLVIFVFWFKRYIVTRKNNDDKDMVQDNVNEDENSLNNIV